MSNIHPIVESYLALYKNYREHFVNIITPSIDSAGYDGVVRWSEYHIKEASMLVTCAQFDFYLKIDFDCGCEHSLVYYMGDIVLTRMSYEDLDTKLTTLLIQTARYNESRSECGKCPYRDRHKKYLSTNVGGQEIGGLFAESYEGLQL